MVHKISVRKISKLFIHYRNFRHCPFKRAFVRTVFRIRMFLSLLDPDHYLFYTNPAPDPSINKQKIKNLDFGQCCGSGSGMGRKSASGSGMNNPDHIF
jgi:hypothetical protein